MTFWADRAANESALRVNLLSLESTRSRHAGNDPDVARHDSDLGPDEFYLLNQPSQVNIQTDLFYEYRTNEESYSRWPAWRRQRQPHFLVIWGKYESSFDPSEPDAYRRDVPNTQVHIVCRRNRRTNSKSKTVSGPSPSRNPRQDLCPKNREHSKKVAKFPGQAGQPPVVTGTNFDGHRIKSTKLYMGLGCKIIRGLASHTHSR